MKRDYAKSSRRYAPRRRSPIWFIFLGLMFGAATMAGVFWKIQGGTWPPIQALQKKEPKQQEKAKKEQAQKSVSAPRFDFYTLLPQDEVEVPGEIRAEKEAKANPDPVEKPNPKLAEKAQDKPNASAVRTWVNPNRMALKPLTDKKGVYFLQAGVFTRYSEADRLKAHLGLIGQTSVIKVQQQNGLKTYRVVLGPYGNHTTASVKQLELAKNQVSSFVIGEP